MTRALENLFIGLLQEQLKHTNNPLSAEALLSIEELEFRTLSGRFLGGACNGTAEFIVHNLLDIEKRMEIFASRYDLGNPKVLNKEEVRQGALIDRLAEMSNSAEDCKVNNIESVLKALKYVVKDLTGKDFQSYTRTKSDNHRSYAIKALCTLYRYRMWEPKIFSRFTLPKKASNYNLELRDAYPLQWKDDSARYGVAIYSDLKQSLNFGMDSEEIKTLLPSMKRLSDRYAQSQFAAPEVLLQYLDKPKLNGLNWQRDDIVSRLPIVDVSETNRLDIDLYIGMTLREVELRLLGKNAINCLLVNDGAKVPVFPNWSAEKLMAAIYPIKLMAADRFKIEIQNLLEQSFSAHEFDTAMERYVNLRWIVKSPLDTDPSFNLLETLAAVLTCIGAHTESVRTKAYWYTKKTSSDNPIFYLDSITDFSDISKVPEHYLEYWFRRFMLVMYRLVGREDLWHHHNDLEQLEGERIIKIYRSQDAFSAARIVNAYFEDVQNLAGIPRLEN